MSNLTRAILEAAEAAASFIPSHLKKEFVLIGGAAMIVLGATRITEDIDVAITPQALAEFIRRATNDARFTKDVMEGWEYKCKGPGIEDIRIPLEFLAIGGGFVDAVRESQILPTGVTVASLADMAVYKATCCLDRGKDNDFEDLEFLLRRMHEEGKTFEWVDAEERKILVEAGQSLKRSIQVILDKLLS